MRDTTNDRDFQGGRAAPQPTAPHMSGAALERRRALLRGLGKGSAIVAAAVPIKTLAVTSAVTPDGKMCTVSGVGSTTHSFVNQPPKCGGKSPGYYKTPSHWPNYNATYNKSTFTITKPGGATQSIVEKFGTTLSPNTGTNPGGSNDPAFSSIFGSGSNAGIFWILKNDAPSDEFHWIAALLNAVWYNQYGGLPAAMGYVYPYTVAELINLYNTNYAASLQFIKDYMEKPG